jgi:hypothetical protein
MFQWSFNLAFDNHNKKIFFELVAIKYKSLQTWKQ